MNQLNPASESSIATALMCCDENGLCLKKKGHIDSSHAGTYTAIMRLASQLDGIGTGNPSSPASTTRTRAAVTVSVDTDQFSTIIKQYDGHTVVMKVPVSSSDDLTDLGEAENVGVGGIEDTDVQNDGTGSD